MSTDYIVSSLPTLAFNAPAPLSWEAFVFRGGAVPAPREGETPSPQILATPVAKVMTKTPAFVYVDDYAADILKIFERKRIDDLPVCDRKGKVVGIVDLQDLPKMKVL